jgi:histidinol-phosphatase (PHP family)
MIVRSSLHTHTFRCKHAKDDVEDCCLAAIEGNLSYLGFSEHSPFPCDNYHFLVRDSWLNLEEYLQKIEDNKGKYPNLQIFSGLECEYYPPYDSKVFIDELRNIYKIDYLLCGIHYPVPWVDAYNFWDREMVELPIEAIKQYTTRLVEAIKSGFFDGIVHPDIWQWKTPVWKDEYASFAREIAKAAVDYNVPLEINCNGMRKGLVNDNGTMRYPYPSSKFWEVVSEYKVKVFIGSDSHCKEHVADKIDEALAFAEKYNLTVIPTFDRLLKK